jgi:hypothetical protein
LWVRSGLSGSGAFLASQASFLSVYGSDRKRFRSHAIEITYRKFVWIIQNSSFRKVIEGRFMHDIDAVLLSANARMVKKARPG